METSQESITVETSTDLQKRLKAANDSLYAFANRHGYYYRTVLKVSERWWHRRDRKPHGGIARQIIEQMKAEFCHD